VSVAANPERNIARLAREVGKSRQTLYTWAEEGCPLDRGADAVRQWAQKHKSRDADNVNDRIKLAKARKIEAEAYRIELETAKIEGEIIETDVILREVSQALSTVRSELGDIPDQVIIDVPEDCRAIVHDRVGHYIWIALKRLSSTRYECLGRSSEDVICEAADAIRARRANDQTTSDSEADSGGSDD
jgi:phage terminase Nu1 subunit (DNA packaging protein)